MGANSGNWRLCSTMAASSGSNFPPQPQINAVSAATTDITMNFRIETFPKQATRDTRSVPTAAGEHKSVSASLAVVRRCPIAAAGVTMARRIWPV